MRSEDFLEERLSITMSTGLQFIIHLLQFKEKTLLLEKKLSNQSITAHILLIK